MKSFLVLVELACLWIPIGALPNAKDAIATPTVISSGCAWCSPGPWKTDAGKSLQSHTQQTRPELSQIACSTGEWFAVASSILNP